MVLVWAQLSRAVAEVEMQLRDNREWDTGPDIQHSICTVGSVTGSTGSTWGTLTSRATFRHLQLQQLRLWIERTMGSGKLLLSFLSYSNLFPATENKALGRSAVHRSGLPPSPGHAPEPNYGRLSILHELGNIGLVAHYPAAAACRLRDPGDGGSG